MMVFVGITEGILIGAVYSELFTCFALQLAKLKNKKLWQDYERMVINFTYPFEAGATVFYFWVLAFIFVPNTMWIQGKLVDNSHPVQLNIETTMAVVMELRNSSTNFILNDILSSTEDSVATSGYDSGTSASIGSCIANAGTCVENFTNVMAQIQPNVTGDQVSLIVEKSAQEMAQLWMYDKRYKNQLHSMILIPMVLSLTIPMLFATAR